MLLATVPRAVETLEHVWQFVRGHAGSIIRNGENNAISPSFGANIHFVLAIYERVRDQVVQHNFYTRAICVDRRKVVGNMQGKGRASKAQALDGLCYKVLHSHRFAIEQEQTGFLAREIKQVADEQRQSVCFAADGLQEMALVSKRP